MKEYIFLIFIKVCLCNFSIAQTNIFPSSGSAGLGTTTPGGKLEIMHAGGQLKLSGGTVAAGVWTSSTDLLHLADWNTGTKGITINMTTGNIGMGMSPSSQAKLEVVGPGSGQGVTLKVGGGGDLMLNAGGSLFFDGNYSYATGNYVKPLATNTQAFFTSGVERLRIDPAGNIGIGTAPASLLHLKSLSPVLQVHSTQSDGSASLNLVNDSGFPGLAVATYGSGYINSASYARANGASLHTTSNASASAGLAIAARNAAGFITLHTGGDTERIRITADGNVGIGTNNPNQKLTVNGIIYGKEVKVNLSVPGPDYVFESDYQLPSLREVKNYIDQHKHLPEVPSAKEMEVNGIHVGEMNMILLKKIEELTLYMLQQQKQLDAQQKEIQDLKSQKK